MKRLIKFNSPYESDKGKFSDCSTRYELLPEIVSDDAGSKELKDLAAKHGIKTVGRVSVSEKPQYDRGLTVIEYVKTDVKVKGKGMYSEETYQQYLGFITIPKGCLEPLASLKNELTPDQGSSILNAGDYGLDDVGEMEDGTSIIVMSGWNYFHALEVAGYSLESLRKTFDVNDTDDQHFHDSVYRCSDCGVYDYSDSGYTSNFRIVGCELLGVNCGCYETAM